MSPRMLIAPLQLKEITLRGLGPYLHGAKLEIKPLTILCGKNGSGKSTWIEALRFLKMAAVDDLFPLKAHREVDCFSQHSKFVNKLTTLAMNNLDEERFAEFKDLCDGLNALFDGHA